MGCNGVLLLNIYQTINMPDEINKSDKAPSSHSKASFCDVYASELVK